MSAYTKARRLTFIQRARRRNVEWGCAEQRRAVEMRARGKSYGQIALAIGRTPDAVSSRLRYLREIAG